VNDDRHSRDIAPEHYTVEHEIGMAESRPRPASDAKCWWLALLNILRWGVTASLGGGSQSNVTRSRKLGCVIYRTAPRSNAHR
jgi:hypothetical protein